MRNNGMRIVVAGDTGTGKTTLILTAVSDKFPTQVPPVLPPSQLRHELLDGVPITIIDTPSGIEHSDKRAEEFKRADCVVFTYACDRRDTLDNLSSYWLPELRRLKVKVPVMLVGCKKFCREGKQRVSLRNMILPILEQFPEIDSCIRPTAYKSCSQALEVFNRAKRAVLYPGPPIFDRVTQTFTPQCLKGLKRIFLQCDLDRDGALSDAELETFWVKFFSEVPHLHTIHYHKWIVLRKLPEGVNEHGLTLKGFLCLHERFLEERGFKGIWTILRNFGYNNDIRLVDNFLTPFKPAPDQSVELSNVARDFLRGTFSMYDKDNVGVIRPAELEDLFSTAPDCPWSQSPYLDAASTTASGGLTLNGFLSEWVLMTLLEPAKTVEYLKYIMYDRDAASAIRLTRKRCKDRKKRQSERNVYHCFVFGPKQAGKSALLDFFLGRFVKFPAF